MGAIERTPMTFAEFGDAFADQVLVPDIIGPRVAALLPKDIAVREDVSVAVATVRGAADVESVEHQPVDPDETSTLRRHRAWVTLDLSLRLTVGFHKENYRVDGRFPLDLVISVVRPLHLLVDVEPPSHEDIEVSISGGGRLKLAEKVGNLDTRIRGHVIEIVEEMVARTEVHRTFDIVEIVHLALGGMEVEPLSGELVDLREDESSGVATP